MTDATDIAAQVAARTKAQRTPRPYVYPGTEIPISVRLLPEREVDDAKLEAQRYVTKRKGDLTIDPEFFDREVQRQIIWHAVVQRDALEKGEPVRLFPSDADVRELDTVTTAALWALYLEHQEACATIRKLDADKVAELAKVVRSGPGGALVQFSQYDHETLVRVLVSVLDHPPEPEPTST